MAGSPADVQAASKRAPPALRSILLVLSVEGLRYEYETEGKRASALVVRKGAGHGRGPQHHVFYRFTIGRRSDHRRTTDVWPRTGAVLSTGGPVTIEYLRSSPETNRIPGQRARSWIFGLMAAAALGPGVSLVVRNRRRQANLSSATADGS